MMHTRNILHRALLLLALPLLPACEKETGISNRHLHGVVTLPPVPLWEGEPLGASTNDVAADAEGPFYVEHAYAIVRGAVSGTCDWAAGDATSIDSACASSPFRSPDNDWMRVRPLFAGPFVVKARAVGDAEADVVMSVEDPNGVELYTNRSSMRTRLDADGNEIEDSLGVEAPRWSATVESGQTFMVHVQVASDEDDVEYELVLVGMDPNEHDINRGIEGDTGSVSTPTGEPLTVDALELKVGAYLEADVERLGNPVGGTTCSDWTYDEATETFWCPFDMEFVHAVSVESNTLIEGMGDGIDNDCDGRADTGTEEVDADGDGVTIAAGDCNDTDPNVHPLRGDEFGNRKDDDCDGWADNGPDDHDDDGDGHCENGVDLDGDGVCRGLAETRSGLGGGDCNDADPRIAPWPGTDTDIAANGFDDNCDQVDAVLDLATNTDNDAIPGSTPPRQWPDLEEEACGTNPRDETSRPTDVDGDGLCDSTCLGTVDCPQDWDGDGLHNWDELRCGSDPEAATAALPDADGDGTCDGKDTDADGDGFTVAIQGSGEDCNDTDPSIHPHVTDAITTAVTEWHYDVVNGIDDDCDGLVDENFIWRLEGTEYVSDAAYDTVDEDGDGFSLGLRDCDDTNPNMRIGNYETRSSSVVRDDFSTVFLFAGDVTTLNSTGISPNSRRTPTVTAYDLDKERVQFTLEPEWEEGVPPQLRAGGLPVLQASFVQQPEVGRIWLEATDPGTGDEIPNDVEMAGFGPAVSVPWPDGQYQELGDAARLGTTNELYGNISTIVSGSWDGDNDAFHVTFPEGGYIEVKLDWTAGEDYDSQWICYFYNAANPPNYYRIPFDGTSLAGFQKPEEGRMIVPLPPAADCWFFVVGYSGAPGPWSMYITTIEP